MDFLSAINIWSFLNMLVQITLTVFLNGFLYISVLNFNVDTHLTVFGLMENIYR